MESLKIPEKDLQVLRGLAEKLAAIAKLPVQKEKARLWSKVNDLKSERPMVLISEVPWHEMNVNNELTLQSMDPWARKQELDLRLTLYTWQHMPADMTVNEYLTCPLVVHSTGFGIEENVDVVETDKESSVVSRHFKVQIAKDEDLKKIKLPVVTYDKEQTDKNYKVMCEVYKDILPVKKTGVQHIWYTPWDFLVRWYGIQEAMIDMLDRPDFVNAAVARVAESCMAELEQYEKLNLLSLGNARRTGSGGYGYTEELPGENYDPNCVRPHNMWGCSNAQIFSEVSPEMHWEFALKHDIPWLQKWGRNYYGCCEPLDRKIDILKRIPNLRKISVSPWANKERALQNIGGDYVISYKINPATLAGDTWNIETAVKEVREVLERADKKCHIEFIIKDISTVSYHPERLWELSKRICEMAEEQ